MHSYYAWITDYVLTRSILADMPELEKMYDKVSTFKQADDRWVYACMHARYKAIVYWSDVANELNDLMI